MLEITIPAREFYDENTDEFIITKEQTLKLEHSLVSISKWESHYHKPFLVDDPMSVEETRYYVKCMTITQNVDPNVYLALTNENIRQVNAYMKNPMTATTFTNESNTPSREIITSEIIYYWMSEFNIPPEYQKWHINRLLTLIKVCSYKKAPPKQMSKQEILSQQRALNEARKKKYNSKG